MTDAQDRSEELEIPGDLYGLFLVEPLQLNPKVDGWIIVILAASRVCFFVLLAYVIQITYILRIHLINRELEGNQCDHPVHLQVTCIFVFSMAGFQEVRDCMDFLAVLYWCPTVPFQCGSQDYKQVKDSAAQHGAVLGAESQGLKQRGWFFRRKKAAKGPKTWEHTWKVESMSMVWKVTCTFVVFIPRLLICAALIRVAAGLIMRGTEERMIVDTVAALFIMEISSFIYNAFTTHAVKDEMTDLNTLQILTSTRLRVFSFVFVNFVYPILVIAFSVTVVWYLRLACSDEESFYSALTSFKSWQTIFEGSSE